MNCIEFETATELAVERREPLEPLALEHVRSCADCRNVWERLQRLEVAIAAWQFTEPPAGLADSVIAELARPAIADDIEDVPIEIRGEPRFASRFVGASRPEKRYSHMTAIASVAACLLIAVVFAIQSTGNRPFVKTQVAKNRTSEQLDELAPMDVSGTLTAVLSDLNSEYREMATETKTVARAMVDAIPHPVAVTVLPDTDEIKLHPNSSDVVRMWQPIGSRVESALGFLWEAMPSDVPSG